MSDEREPTRSRSRSRSPVERLNRELATRESPGHGMDVEGNEFSRPRGRFRTDFNTIPATVTQTRAIDAPGSKITLYGNFIKISPLAERQIHAYRVDFEPNIESKSLRRRLLMRISQTTFSSKIAFDGVSDVRAGQMLPEKITKIPEENPNQPGQTVVMTLKHVGVINWGSSEMLRTYNINMKNILKQLGFFQVSKLGSYVHPSLSTPIGNNQYALAMVRGFNTAANVHEDGQILMNLESVHKIMHTQNVLEIMKPFSKHQNVAEVLKSLLVGKLVVTSYNKIIYKVEDVRLNTSPKETFYDKRNDRYISYLDYYKNKYDIKIISENQPLLVVIPNNRRQNAREQEPEREEKEILVVPELCNLAGLTDAERSDNRLKMDLIRSSQIAPKERVDQIRKFLGKLHENFDVIQLLKNWGYSYEKEPVEIIGRQLKPEVIGLGKTALRPPDAWPKVGDDGSFDQILMREQVVQVPPIKKLLIIIPSREAQNKDTIVEVLKKGFTRVGLIPEKVEFDRMDRDGAQDYTRSISRIAPDVTASIVVLSSQNKEKYDAVKKLASCQRGVITQVITSRLMCDQRKAGGAAVKIGIQLAAKIGGEPWHINMPLKTAMICGYDTYHDTTNRGRSFGAFVATMNPKYSRWWSKADYHDRSDELSSNMAANMGTALAKYRELNGKNPDRVFLYRDGVGDGQLGDVFDIEMKKIAGVVHGADNSIKFTFIVVNKHVGARFYMKLGNDFRNPPPGTVIDSVVTRKERYDFYLVSQSTRNGTVSPTYYNIIHDESGLDAGKHQTMAYKMCFLYYNWSGTVRVPAPCQYAHKLAFLCGEHLHDVPNAILDDKLHFL